MKSCPVCFEQVNAEECFQLESCTHEFCRSCLILWFETVEEDESSSGSGFEPPRKLRPQMPSKLSISNCLPCPQCRQPVHEKDVMRILGRAARVVSTNRNESMSPSELEDGGVADSSIDEFTITWLIENGARQCPGCGICIIRSTGCNNMMCRCGHRFNFESGVSFYEVGTFYDNVQMKEDDEFSNYSRNSDIEDFYDETSPHYLSLDEEQIKGETLDERLCLEIFGVECLLEIQCLE